MAEKVLGKITEAQYGTIKDYPFCMGLVLNFKLGTGGCVGDGGKYTINMSSACKWDQQERQVAIARNTDKILQILKDAKVNYVSELVNKPVEVTIESHIFKDFRILTEVL